MTKDTTTEVHNPDRAETSEMLGMLHAINPHQREQFEAVFTALLEHMLGASPKPDLFEADKGGQYTDMMVSMSFQLWLNAKLNHMADLERKIIMVREALAEGDMPGPGVKPH